MGQMSSAAVARKHTAPLIECIKSLNKRLIDQDRRIKDIEVTLLKGSL